MIMMLFRSIIFNCVFFATTSLALIFCYPMSFCGTKYSFIFWKYLSMMLNFITINIVGIRYIIENPHNLMNEPAIYAIRHESAWETLILIHLFREPVLILKKELMDIPFFGAMARATGAISIDRSNGVKSLINVAKEAKRLSQKHPIIIFPEGTRVATGQHVDIKRGISLIYEKTNCPVIPVIHNAGQFWPSRGFFKKPGKIILKFADPIMPGLSRDEFMIHLNGVFYNEVEKLKSLACH